jgi:hypothetical protein
MSLVKEITKGLLPEEEKKTVGIYAGGFKPPTKGHFEVLKLALEENPEIDEMLVLIGKKERGGISQEESFKIWQIYSKYLPFKVKYIKSTVAPIREVYDYAKENPDTEVLWVIGARENVEDDFSDIASRTKSITKYPNLELRTIVTKGGVSGTAARNAVGVSKEKFEQFIPDFLTEKEKQDIYVMLTNEIQEQASYSQGIDVKQKIKELTKHMLDKGMNIKPLPKVKFINDDVSNAKEFLGKTAYYDPNTQTIVLYTLDRHPKDIVRSFSHEMIHHIQNLEDRLGNIQTTNTQEDDNLNDIEAEANLKGTMTFRNWTDSLQESQNTKATKVFVMKSPFTPKGWDFDHIGFVLDNGMLKDMSGHRYDKDQPMPPMTYKYEDTEELFQMPKEKSLPKPIEIPSNVACDIKDPNKKAINCGSFVKIVLSNNGIETTKSDKPGDIFKAISTEVSEKKNKDPFGLNAYAMELARLREDEGQYKVYLDMDGVLADFDQRFRDLSGMEPKEYEAEYGTEEFWNFIDEKNKIRFWVGIPVMPGAKQLVDAVKNYDYEILTAPSAKKQSRLGKRLWIRNHQDIFGGAPKINFKKAKEKHLVKPELSQYDILVDDRKDTINRWNEAGGTGIFYQNINQVLSDLKKLGL